MSLLFGMCALTRLAGFLLRIGIGFIAQRAKNESVANQSDAWPAWLGIIAELTLASLGSIYLLDAMRFAVLNFTTSLGQEGAILPGDLTLALYVGLFGSSAILQSSGVQVPGFCRISVSSFRPFHTIPSSQHCSANRCVDFPFCAEACGCFRVQPLLKQKTNKIILSM